VLLVLIGAGVVGARSMGHTRAETPRSIGPTTVTSAPAPQAAATPVPRAFQAVVTATAPRATLVAPTRTTLPTRAPAATPRTLTVATATPTPGEPTPVTTIAAATSTPNASPTHVATTATVALTFDAGADRGYAEDILDVLQDEHVVASFGMTGQWARANPDLVRRMAADGHLVFNHTLDHRSFTGVSDRLGGLSPARRRAELEDADAIIAPLIGHSTRPYYRLPYGDDDARVAADVQPAGYSHKIGWTIDSLGWRGTPSAEIVARCLRLAAPGAVYVLHVGRASQDAVAVSQIIRGLRERGFGFRRVD
jgi:peptidoglycan/xylan/chitin deacetylase (PgdA/CDA1 family)